MNIRLLLFFFICMLLFFNLGIEDSKNRVVKQDISKMQYRNTDESIGRNNNTAYLAKLVGINNEWEKGYTGKGVTIAVLDSGVYPHPDLTKPENRIIAFKDLVNNKDEPYDDYGHGTFVAGIIAGNGNLSSGKYKGIAPDANIVAVKVLSVDGGCSAENIIQGIDWVIANKNKYNIKILNLSVGQKINETVTSDKISLKAEEAIKNGIIVITSVGNRKINLSDKYSPAISPKVIAVGSVDSNNFRTLDIADDRKRVIGD